MKRITFFAAFVTAFAAVSAEEYTSFSFKEDDGTETTLDANGLTITFSEGSLVASSGNVTHTLSLASLQEMYFSNGLSNVENEVSSNISVCVRNHSIYVNAELGAKVSVVNSLGVVLNQDILPTSGEIEVAGKLPNGIYIVNVNGQTHKVLVK